MTNARSRRKAAHLAIAITVLASMGTGVSSPASAVGCYPDGRISTYYDYAWITDTEDVCGYMAVRHYYVISGAGGGWTSWYGGTGHHYETPKIKQLQYGNWQG
jgi:hypothetical protein